MNDELDSQLADAIIKQAADAIIFADPKGVVRQWNTAAEAVFGFTADELFAWVQYGGGQELWDALSGQYNVKPLLCLNTGVQMGGWFNRELSSLDGFKGLRYRMPGLGGEVLRRLGAIVVNLPGPPTWIGRTVRVRVERTGAHSVWGRAEFDTPGSGA